MAIIKRNGGEPSDMEININSEHNYVSIWLTRAECANAAFRAELKPLFSKYKQMHYRVVVFESGEAELASITKAILKHNLTASKQISTNEHSCAQELCP